MSHPRPPEGARTAAREGEGIRMPLPFRALEMHGQRMWERPAIVRTLAFMQRHGLNALVLHESDLVHQIVYPRKYFDPYALWSDLPSRRGENAIFSRRAYMDQVLKLASAAGVTVWLNVKEIGFSDEVLAIHPEVIKNGVFCPSEPFWNEYITEKTNDLFTDFPAMAGVIVSFSSQESRASRAQNRCRCALCAAEPLTTWYGKLIATLHAPVARHGKRLAIRDFAYKPQDHEPLIDAMRSAPEDVIFCIKSMPHDFYIPFPHNPAIGALKRPQWVEYDVMGQFFGWGVMPCTVVDDLAQRIPYWEQHGVEGGIFRIEWERINDLDALDTLNEINLIAAAALSQGQPIDTTGATRRWLVEHGHEAVGAQWLGALLERTWPVVRGAAYIHDHVSADNSMLPRSVERAWWGMESRDSLAVWDQSRAADLQLDRAKAEAYLKEKDDALAAARLLCADVRAGASGVDPKLHAYVTASFAHFEIWVEGLVLCANICIYCRWLEQGSDTVAGDATALERLLDMLAVYGKRVQALADDPAVPHQAVMLVDPHRAADIQREGRATLARVREKQPA